MTNFGRDRRVGLNYAQYLVIVVMTLVSVSVTIRPTNHYIFRVPHPANNCLN